MLRKRSRSIQKDQNMGHLISDESYSNSDAFLKQKLKTNSFFTAPGLFVGLNPKGSESDSVRSPTSPLDFRVFSKSNLGNPFRSAKPNHEGTVKSWDCNKVGLSIVDSLNDEMKQSGKVLRSSDSKNILFGPQMRIKAPNLKTPFNFFETPNSLPKNFAHFPYTNTKPSDPQMCDPKALFEIGEALLEDEPLGKFCSSSLDSTNLGSHFTILTNPRTQSSATNLPFQNGQNLPTPFLRGSSSLSKSSGIGLNPGKDFVGSLSASEIELSEDYTCIRTHGPNPKTTHIYGDCILECHSNEFTNSSHNQEQDTAMPSVGKCSEVNSPSYGSEDFLSFCFSCKKKLDGEDIYMYRGEKAFCSWSCRSQEILMDEELEKINNNSSSKDTAFRSNSCEGLFETSMFIAST